MWRLQTRGDDGSFDVYRFAEERHHQVDIEMANHDTATHPSSPFVDQLVAQHRGNTYRLGLVDTDLTVTTTDGDVRTDHVPAGQVPEVLANRFGFELTATKRSAVIERLTETT